jgi:ATP-dependent protease HslVU (ClpYQ) peptidase subunit
MLVADKNHTFELTGNGDVLEPHQDAMGKYAFYICS